jgi:hypothetical protein
LEIVQRNGLAAMFLSAIKSMVAGGPNQVSAPDHPEDAKALFGHPGTRGKMIE